jgi:CDP-paratose 2-epimerase
MRPADRESRRVIAREPGADERPILITGGAGFIGCNLAHRLLSSGQHVRVLDNLSRSGVERNLRWLRDTHGDLLHAEIADIRDVAAVRRAVHGARQVFHFAAQVAVTTSLEDPAHDFTVNARGTLNLLEAVREQDDPPPLVYTSTNKVYGGLDDVRLAETDERYEPADDGVRQNGINERRRLDFHSPYGCSKGTADQYVTDYARSFGMRTAVFRMSCIYGPHQYGNEDQGWVAHFLIRAIEGRPLMIYGDGKQVRDALFVEDLVDAFLLAQKHMPTISGRAFNIGGGPGNTLSLLELLDMIADLHGERPEIAYHDWRVGDQRYYVSDTAQFQKATGWAPKVDVATGVRRLYEWLRDSRAATPERASRRRPFVSHVAGTTAPLTADGPLA